MIGLALVAAASVLAPAGSWSVNYGIGMCHLTRSFGSGEDAVILGIEAVGDPTRNTATLVLVTSPGDGQPFRMFARMEAEPSMWTQQRYATSWVDSTASKRHTRIGLRADDVAALGQAERVHVTAGSVDVLLVPSITPAAIAALTRCTDDLWRTWGVDPAERDRIVTPAKERSNPGEWVSDNDYPPDALRQRAEGNPTLIYAVGVDGRIQDCKVVVSSGSQALDDASCRAISKRGRYFPATDAHGQPLASHFTQRIHWALPVR